MTPRVRQRFVCSECDTGQFHRVDPNDTDRSIRIRCDHCKHPTEQEPAGPMHWF